MATVTVANQGHAPLLKDPTTIEAIRHFLTAADAGRQFATWPPLSVRERGADLGAPGQLVHQ